MLQYEADFVFRAGTMSTESDVLMSWLCVAQVAEIISDVREPIMEASQPVDENERRRQQVQVGNSLPAEIIHRQLDLFQLASHIGPLLHPHYYSVCKMLRKPPGYWKAFGNKKTIISHLGAIQLVKGFPETALMT